MPYFILRLIPFAMLAGLIIIGPLVVWRVHDQQQKLQATHWGSVLLGGSLLGLVITPFMMFSATSGVSGLTAWGACSLAASWGCSTRSMN